MTQTTIESRGAEQSLRMARAYAAERLSWFAPCLFAARLVITRDCPSLAAVDEGLRVYFNPDLVEKLLAATERRTAVIELAWVWVHEVSHVLREHAARAKELEAQPLLWNVAADLEINDSEWADLPPPRQWPPLLPSRYDLEEGKLAEVYYRQLEQKPKSAAQFAQNGFAQDEGSGAHGQQRPWEVAADAHSAPSVSSFDQDLIRRQVAKAIAEQKNRSDIPLGWRRWANDRMCPQVNWRELLRRRARGAATVGLGLRSDYRFDRPHRRAQLYQPLLRPSLRADSMPRIACVVDTSGSMSDRELGRVLAEIRGVLELLRMPITVIPCDAVPYTPVKVLTDSDLLKLSSNLQGGGGTDMVAGIDSALALLPAPDMVLVLTDGYTPFPSTRCPTPVIFGILQAGSDTTPEPPMPPWRPSDLCVIPSE